MTPVPGPGAIAPGSWLGVLGGGQLGRMFCHAAQALGYRVCVLDPVADGPAGAVADRQIVAAYDDLAALRELGGVCAAVTTEFENVPAGSLEQLARYCPVRPYAAAVAVAQDRIREKQFLRDCGVEVAPYAPITRVEDFRSLDPSLFPGILKTARLGYDGKGQMNVSGPEQAEVAWRRLGALDCVLERRMPLRRELSVIVARGQDGASAVFAASENEHRDGILASCVTPARIDPTQAECARQIAERVARALEYVGVLCVELFELDDGRLLANEIAPRPHNSGHATLDAAVCSQFAQQVRTLATMPLGEPRQHSPAVMLNLLGDLWFGPSAAPRAPAFDRVLSIPGACLHLYGKSEARAGRKMGHVTIIAATLGLALERARAVAAVLDLPLPDSLLHDDPGSARSAGSWAR